MTSGPGSRLYKLETTTSPEALRTRIAAIRSASLPVARIPRPTLWARQDRMFRGTGVVHYLILDAGGCRWALESGGCSMCGYVNDTCRRPVSDAEMASQLARFLKTMPGSKGPYGLRIFTSGSSLDDREIGPKAWEMVFEGLRSLSGLSELTVESRPQHVTEEKVASLVESIPGVEVEVAMGLETSSDWIREACIGKGFAFEEFVGACRAARSCGARTKAYVLLKPPFLSEFDSGCDSVQTVLDIRDLVDSVSLNACNVQKGTLVEELFRAGMYRPPWIWTVLEVLREARRSLEASKNVICDQVAFGTRRGPHNCKRCDRAATGMVSRFSLSQDPCHLEGLECACRGDWEEIYNYHFR